MSTTTTQAQPDLNHAADALIEALEHVTDMASLRGGLTKQHDYWSMFADPSNPSHRDAIDLLAVWRALDDLAAAVQGRKENTDD